MIDLILVQGAVMLQQSAGRLVRDAEYALFNLSAAAVILRTGALAVERALKVLERSERIDRRASCGP